MNEESEVVSSSTDLEPVGPAGLVLPVDARLSLVAEQLVDQARADGVALLTAAKAQAAVALLASYSEPASTESEVAA